MGVLWSFSAWQGEARQSRKRTCTWAARTAWQAKENFVPKILMSSHDDVSTTRMALAKKLTSAAISRAQWPRAVLTERKPSGNARGCHASHGSEHGNRRVKFTVVALIEFHRSVFSHASSRLAKHLSARAICASCPAPCPTFAARGPLCLFGPLQFPASLHPPPLALAHHGIPPT